MPSFDGSLVHGNLKPMDPVLFTYGPELRANALATDRDPYALGCDVVLNGEKLTVPKDLADRLGEFVCTDLDFNQEDAAVVRSKHEVDVSHLTVLRDVDVSTVKDKPGLSTHASCRIRAARSLCVLPCIPPPDRLVHGAPAIVHSKNSSGSISSSPIRHGNTSFSVSFSYASKNCGGNQEKCARLLPKIRPSATFRRIAKSRSPRVSMSSVWAS